MSLLVTFISAQKSVVFKLEACWRKLMTDSQMQYGSAGICIMDINNGQVIFERSSNIGMAPASTQKILTSIAAFEALGYHYKYDTKILYNGTITNKKLNGDLLIEGSGDPTLGSFRFPSNREEIILTAISNAIKQLGIDTINGNIIGTDKGFDINPIPDGWTWGDMGNYYGSGHWGLNWNENQYDLFFKTGNKKGDSTSITRVEPNESLIRKLIHNEVSTGDPSTGDASIIYAAPFSLFKLVQGAIGSNRNDFKVSGSYSLADLNCLSVIQSALKKNGIEVTGKLLPVSAKIFSPEKISVPSSSIPILRISSPSLDSIVYWFLKKSVNLYGEALVRTIGLEKKGYGSTNKGLEWIDSFYTANNMDTKAMHMTDGSGLSPINRITPFFLVKALQFAKTKPWFPAFYDALPIYNDMKLKSGTIHRTKCFAGYHNNYIVSIMVNNYNGSTSMLTNKMFKVLDELK